MELRQLRYFQAVARRRNFRAAADDLLVAQPAISQAIKRLEAELGLALFDRSTRPIALTHAGRRLLEHAEAILAGVDRAEADLQSLTGLLRGKVVIGALQWLTHIDLAGLLGGFHDRHPGIEVLLRTGTTEELLKMLLAGEIDLAMAHVDRDQGPGSLVAETLLSDELVVIMALNHPLAGSRRIAPAELKDTPFIAFKPGASVQRALERAASEAGFEPRIAFEVSDLATAVGLAARNLGVAVVPSAAADLEAEYVASVPLGPPTLEHNLALLWNEDRYRSAAAQTFLEFARAQLSRGGLHRMLEASAPPWPAASGRPVG